jgi:hypothetical protein
MAFELKFKTIIDTGSQRKELVLISHDRDAAIMAACKIAERMGGCFLDIVTCELAQGDDT